MHVGKADVYANIKEIEVQSIDRRVGGQASEAVGRQRSVPDFGRGDQPGRQLGLGKDLARDVETEFADVAERESGRDARRVPVGKLLRVAEGRSAVYHQTREDRKNRLSCRRASTSVLCSER